MLPTFQKKKLYPHQTSSAECIKDLLFPPDIFALPETTPDRSFLFFRGRSFQLVSFWFEAASSLEISLSIAPTSWLGYDTS